MEVAAGPSIFDTDSLPGIPVVAMVVATPNYGGRLSSWGGREKALLGGYEITRDDAGKCNGKA